MVRMPAQIASVAASPSVPGIRMSGLAGNRPAQFTERRAGPLNL